MSDTPKLPGLSGKTEAELRSIYEAEVGGEVPDNLSTVDKLKTAIKEHRGSQEPAEAPKDTITLVHTDGRVREFTPQTLALLGSDTGGYSIKAEKPASLPKA